jgi:hypothetical protein
MQPRELIPFIQAALTPELLHAEWSRNPKPFAGHCYVASEALYHLAGGKQVGLVPASIRHEGSAHWFLRECIGGVLDVTAMQFDSPVPYVQGVGRGFLTKGPSRRARIVMDRVRRSITGRLDV